jgi:hypothetical protein
MVLAWAGGSKRDGVLARARATGPSAFALQLGIALASGCGSDSLGVKQRTTMNIEVKRIASDLWEAYDLDKPEADQVVGSASTEIELDDIIAAYERRAKRD